MVKGRDPGCKTGNRKLRIPKMLPRKSDSASEAAEVGKSDLETLSS
jgi:hypothetical protein